MVNCLHKRLVLIPTVNSLVVNDNWINLRCFPGRHSTFLLMCQVLKNEALNRSTEIGLWIVGNPWTDFHQFKTSQTILYLQWALSYSWNPIEHLFCINLVIFLTDVKVMKNNTKPYLADCGELGTPPGMLQAISGRQAAGPACLRNYLRDESWRRMSLQL